MPLVDDYDQSEEKQPGGGSGADGEDAGGGGGGSGGGGAVMAAPSKQQESTFVPWSRFVSANEDVSKREAGQLASQVKGDVEKAQKGLGDASNAFNTAIDQNYDNPTPREGMPRPEQQATGSIDAGAAEGAFANPNAGNPWASWLPEEQQPAATARPNTVFEPTPSFEQTVGAPSLNPDRLKTDVTNGAPLTSGYGLTGSSSLETQMGAPAWSKLLGDTRKAESGASALGSEAGVESLLQQSNPLAPNSAFDAALISGAGGKDFRDLSRQFGDGKLSGDLADASRAASDRWAKLQGDVKAGAEARDAEIRAATDEMNRIAEGQRQAEIAAGDGSGGTKGTSNPWGYASYDDMMADGGIGTDIRDTLHGLVNDTSLSNAAVDELGKAGVYSGNNVAEEFRKGVGLGDDLDMQNIRGTLGDIGDNYGEAATRWLFDNLTPEQWASLKGMNAGAMYRVMQQILDQAIQSGAFKPPAPGTPGGRRSETTPTGYTSGEADAGTTADQETARTNAYREGWGEEWDRQFREGNQNPQRGG